jgi:hypothetical protein
MAATIAVISTAGQRPSAPTFHEQLDVTGDASYTTGGYDLGLATLFPGRTVVGVIVQPTEGGTALLFEYDYATGFLKFLDGNAVEIAPTTDVQADTAKVVVIFK